VTELIGNFSLCGAVLASAFALLACVAAGRIGEARWLGRARLGLLTGAICLTVTGAALTIALYTLDLRFAYVANHTERALPPEYRLAAFWSGQEGSLLLWGWMIAAFSTLAAFLRRRLAGVAESGTLGTLAAIVMFFAALLLFAANPFALVKGTVPFDGRGLNPQLQHWAMVLHPPTLFLGYAGFAVPFAIVVGALLARRTDNAWIAQTRRWVIAAWLFLGAGIALGAWWAYVELGWGGYWAWDPVENASLLPWLTGTALIHSVIIHEHRGMLKAWSVSLAALTFILCIFGTYLTRSGVIQSVHAFGESLIGTFFLAFLALLVVGSAVLIIGRRSLLRPDHRMESVVGREGLFLFGNVLFLIMTATTLVGTIFPLISGPFMKEPISVGPSFYNRVVGPMALVMAALMAAGPVLVYGVAAAGTLRRGLALPGIITVVALAVAAVLGLRSVTSLACLAIAVVAITTMLVTFMRVVAAQVSSNGGSSVLATALRLIDTNHRRYGGQLAHLGIVLIILGVAGSSLYAEKETVKLAPGDTTRVGRYLFRYDGIKEVRGNNFTAVQADVTLLEPVRSARVLSPQRRFYDKAEDASSEIAIRAGLREDLYVVLAGWEAGGAKTAIQVLVNPLTTWIWIGSIIVTAGGLFTLVPRLLPRPRLATSRLTAPTMASTRGAPVPVAFHSPGATS
jgi:cytochrome c-type biogenesis protein CcmF